MSASIMSADASLDRSLHAIADPTRRKILLALRESKSDVKSPGKPERGPAARHICLADTSFRRRIDVNSMRDARAEPALPTTFAKPVAPIAHPDFPQPVDS